MNKFEKLIEYIINEDEAKAKALFHKIVIEKSRDIYESLVDEDQFPVQRGRGTERLGSEIADESDVIDGDHQGMQEADDEFGGEEGADDFGGEDDFGGDEESLAGEDDFGGEEGADDFGGDEEGMGEEDGLEDRVMDLEDAIDELKAEFDELMSDDAGEEGADEFGGEEGTDEFGGEEGADDFGGDEEGEADFDDEEPTTESGIYGESKKTDKPWTSKDGKAQSGTAVKGDKYTGKDADKEAKAKEKKVKESRKSPNDLMREYIEKVGSNWPNGASEGDEVGASSSKAPINKKSTQISGKNDMGGTTANIARGSASETMPTGPKKPSNAYSKGEKMMGQDKYENSPGAGTKGYKDRKSAKTKEGADTNGTQPVSKDSFNPGGKPGFKG
jgi:hypothetical protein